MEGCWAVVLAGGQGSRLWPRTRRGRPKPALSLGGPSLLRATVARLDGLVPMARVLVVTGSEAFEAVRAELPELPAEAFLVEPSARGTAAAVAWGAAEVARRGGRALLVLPSDHGCRDEPALREALRTALQAALQTPGLVLLGHRPSHPHPGLGYVRVAGEGRVRSVTGFVEKPPRARSEALLAQGALWNGGVVAATPACVDRVVREHLPRTAAAIDALMAGHPPEEAWQGADATSFDHGVLERESGLRCVPCDAGWSDLGTWEALAEALPDHPLGAVQAALAVGVEAGHLVIDCPGRVVAVLGARDLVVVEDGEILMICERSQAHRVPELREALRRLGRHDLI